MKRGSARRITCFSLGCDPGTRGKNREGPEKCGEFHKLRRSFLILCFVPGVPPGVHQLLPEAALFTRKNLVLPARSEHLARAKEAEAGDRPSIGDEVEISKI